MAEQFDLWGGDVQPKQPTQKQIKPNEPKPAETQTRSTSYYAQTALTESSPAIHYVVLVNRVAGDVRDLYRYYKFEEEKRLKLEEQVAKLTKAVVSISSDLKTAIETINQIVTEAEEDAADRSLEDGSLVEEGDEE